MSEPEAVRLLERILATTTNEINGHKVWRQVATGKAKEWTAAIEDAAMFLNNRRAFDCLPQAHRYDTTDNPDVLVCRRCGKLRPA